MKRQTIHDIVTHDIIVTLTTTYIKVCVRERERESA